MLPFVASVGPSAAYQPPQQPRRADSDAQPAGGGEPSASKEPAAEPQALLVEGQVTNSIGAGIEGVAIAVHRAGGDGSKGEPLATALTDRIGDFTVKVVHVMDGKVVVTFSKPLFSPTTWTGDVTAGEEAPYLPITLQGSLKVAGRVMDDHTDRPVLGANVKLSSVSTQANVTTDEGGYFVFEHLSPGSVTLSVTAKGYGKEKVSIRDTSDATEVSVRLSPERILHLTILDDRGRAVRAATVELLVRKNNDVRLLATNREGMITVRNLCHDCTELAARLSHEDYVSSTGFDRTILLDEDTIETTRTLTMAVAGRLAGTVTASHDGRPQNGARVMTGDGSDGRSPRDWSNYRGRFEIAGVTPGPTVVTTHLAGFAPELVEVGVVGGETTTLDIELSPACTIRGTVVTESEAAVPQAGVQTGRWRGHATLDLRTVTDEKGAFVLANAPCDEVELVVTAPDGHRSVMTINAGKATAHVLTVPDVDMTRLEASTVKVGDAAPDLSLTSLDGRVFRLGELKGKVVVVDFWATWCGPCVVEMPIVEEMQRTFGARDDFLLIGVSQDWEKSAVRNFVRSRKERWPQIVGDEAGATEASNRFGVKAIPALFVIDKEGKFAVTYVSAERAKQTAAALLTGKSDSE